MLMGVYSWFAFTLRAVVSFSDTQPSLASSYAEASNMVFLKPEGIP